jgi:alpha-L-rhamnosidase
MKRILVIISVFTMALIACNKKETKLFPPINFTCESETNPIGIDVQKPSFGWQMSDTSRGSKQTAYQIIVASNPDFLSEEKADMWNSGKVISDKSQFIIYSGKPLQPAKRYYWAIQLFDTTGNPSGFSEQAFFETGLMNNWKAKWVSAPKNLENAASALFRHEILIGKKISEARAYASGLGVYEFRINGQKVGGQQLSPGWSVFEKRIQYQTYDVTSLLKEGKNALGAITAKFWQGNNRLQFIMQLKVTYSDGTTEWFYTGEGWKAQLSTITECDYEKGEKQDLRQTREGWDKPGFNDNDWQVAKVLNNKMNLVAQQLQPVIVKQNLKPIKTLKLEKGRYIFDMGETIPGWIKLKTNGKTGERIKVQYLATYNFKDKTPRKKVATDEVICNKNFFITYEPKFAYHVFRFVEVSGLTDEINDSSLVARIAIPDIETTGQFNCSNGLINQIYSNIFRTGRNNFISTLAGMPTDESRKGSPVSTQAYCQTALYIFDIKKTFEKYIDVLKDLQGTSGKIHFLPGNGEGTFSPGWPDVMMILPWKTYVATGDRHILENNYDAIKSWHDSQQRESDAAAPPYMHNREGNGDLFSTEITPVQPIGSVYYFYSTSVMSEIAKALGKIDEATSYMELAGFTKDQFSQSYLTYRVARYWAETQTAHVLPLAVGLTPLSHAQRVANFIASDIIKNEIHLSTGVLSTHFLLPLLSEYNHHELAYKLITQTSKPSWGYMAGKGPSTIWGSWDGNEEVSNYQLAFASVGEWLYSYLAGIRPDSKYPGYKHSIIDPNPAGDLKWAEASLKTIYGKLSVRWEKIGEKLIVNVEVPSNTSSTIMLPVKSSKSAVINFEGSSIVINGKAVGNCPAFIKFRGFDANMAVLDVQSGKYRFVIE